MISYQPASRSVIGLILAQHNVVADVRDVHALRNEDAAILLVVAGVHLRVVFNIEGWSISWGISAVWSAFLVEDWVNIELNQVVVGDGLVWLSVVQHDIVAELLESVWQIILHADGAVSGQLEAIDWDQSIWRVILLIPVRNTAASHAVGSVVSVALLEAANVEDWQVILIDIQWLDLRKTTLRLDNVVSVSVDDEHPDLGVEDRSAELIQYSLAIDLTTDVAVDTFVVLDDPNVFVVVRNNISQLWDPNISVVEEDHSHVRAVSSEELVSVDSVDIHSRLHSSVKWINSSWLNNDASVDESLWIKECEFNNQALRSASIVWEAGADALADEEEVKWEVEIYYTVLMSESMDADVIWISQSWSEFLVLLVVQHSHVVSEHVIDQISVVWINSLIDVVLVVSSIHGIPAEIIVVEVIGFNEHVIQRTNVDVWANITSLSVKDSLNVGKDFLNDVLVETK